MPFLPLLDGIVPGGHLADTVTELQAQVNHLKTEVNYLPTVNFDEYGKDKSSERLER